MALRAYEQTKLIGDSTNQLADHEVADEGVRTDHAYCVEVSHDGVQQTRVTVDSTYNRLADPDYKSLENFVWAVGMLRTSLEDTVTTASYRLL